MPTATTKLSYADLLALPDDGKRHEIVAGKHFVSPSPSVRHQRVVGNLFFALRAFVQARGLGEVFVAPLDVYLSEHDVVVPDLLFVSAERSSIVEKKRVRGAPDLVVEVLSPGNSATDLGSKRKVYRHFGVREHWLVDPRTETIRVVRGGAVTTLSVHGRASATPTLASPLFPGLLLDLNEVFA